MVWYCYATSIKLNLSRLLTLTCVAAVSLRWNHILPLCFRWLGFYQQLWHQPAPKPGGQTVCSTDPASEAAPVSRGCGWNEWHHRHKVRRSARKALRAAGWESCVQGEMCAPWYPDDSLTPHSLFASCSCMIRPLAPSWQRYRSEHLCTVSAHAIAWGTRNRHKTEFWAWSQSHVSARNVWHYLQWHVEDVLYVTDWSRMKYSILRSVFPRGRQGLGATIYRRCVHSWTRWNKIWW